MRYFVTFPGGDEIPVDVTHLPTGAVEVLVNGEPVSIDGADLGEGATLTRVDGHVYDLWTEGSPPDIGVVVGAGRFFAKVESERMRAVAVRGGGGAGSGVLKSPMPGRVLKVLVAEGDEVQVGTALVVVEAMKMENELCAEVAGSVKKIFVEAGQVVESGQKLVEIG